MAPTDALPRAAEPIIRRPICIALTVIGLILSFGNAAASAGVVAVVSSESPIAVLSKNQVTDIFLGKNTRFPNGSLATPIDQSEGSTARAEFYLRLANMSRAQLKAFWSKIIFTGRGQPPKTVANDVEAKKQLIANLNAIAYIDQSMVDDSVRVVCAP